MTTNRLAKSEGGGPKQCPPDMPRGDSAADKAARQRFWVDYGNAHLLKIGRHDCRWIIRNGEMKLEDVG